MKTIASESTALSQFGLTVDLILSGEQFEFDPEKKLARKEDYVKYEFAKRLVDACNADLLDAYRAIEELEKENARLSSQIGEATEGAERSAKQVRQVLKGEQDLANAEKLLAKFEQQLTTLANDKQADKHMIQQLNAQVEELITLRDTVPQLEEDVNTVLENLRSYFAEEGIPMDEGDYDDESYYE